MSVSWGWVVCAFWDAVKNIKRKKIILLERSVVVERKWTAIFALKLVSTIRCVRIGEISFENTLYF